MIASGMSFGPVGLAAPQGVLGPEGTQGARVFPRPFLFAPSPPPRRRRVRGGKGSTGPKTESGPGAQRRNMARLPRRAPRAWRARGMGWNKMPEIQEGGPCNTPLVSDLA